MVATTIVATGAVKIVSAGAVTVVQGSSEIAKNQLSKKSKEKERIQVRMSKVQKERKVAKIGIVAIVVVNQVIRVKNVTRVQRNCVMTTPKLLLFLLKYQKNVVNVAT